MPLQYFIDKTNILQEECIECGKIFNITLSDAVEKEDFCSLKCQDSHSTRILEEYLDY